MFLVHLQDAHIKPQTWASIPAVKDDAYHALDEMLLALAGMGHDTRDAYLIISGDLFDSTRIHASDLEAVTRLCQNFKRTYYIIGTHDYTEPPFLSSMENTVWLRDEEITDLGEGVRLAGIQYNRSRPYLLECLKKLRKQGFGATCGLRDVLVLHQGFQHLLGFEGAYQLTLADLVEHVPEARVLCGHVHIPDYTLFKGLPGGDSSSGCFLSTGPLYPQEMPQTKAFCGITALDLQKDREDRIDQVPITVRAYPVLRGTDHYLKENLEKLNEESRDSGKLHSLVTIMLQPGETLTSLGIQEELYPWLIIRARINTAPVSPDISDSSQIVDQYTLENAIMEEVPDETMQPIILGMLHSDNPQQYIKKVLEENKVKVR